MMRFKTFVNGRLDTNTYLVYDESTREAMIIDPGYANQELADAAGELKLNVGYIMLTHGHSDHTEGLAFMRRAFPEAKLAAAEAERKLLSEKSGIVSRGGIVPDIELKDGEELELGKSRMRFIMTPGHTKGGMCIYFEKEEVLFSGDTLFFASVGRTDLPGGSDEELAESLERLMRLPDAVRVYPGHGRDTTIAYEKRYNPFV